MRVLVTLRLYRWYKHVNQNYVAGEVLKTKVSWITHYWMAIGRRRSTEIKAGTGLLSFWPGQLPTAIIAGVTSAGAIIEP